MKKIVLIIFAVILLLIGAVTVGYPFISNWLMSKNLSSEVQTYLDTSDKTDKTILESELKKALKYNESFVGSVRIGDPFSSQPEYSEEYYNLLNLDGTSVMACIEIPSINVKYPIYHGTSNEVLEKGVGHLKSSSLPVGGKSTHAVLTGHTGVSNLKIFTDLDKLKKGDKFFIHVLNKTLAYEVDNIAVVLPDETSLLQIDEGKDYVTLVTCTPYGQNTHRLLVRGKAVAYSENDIETENQKLIGSTYNEQYIFAVLIGICVMLGILIIYFICMIIIRRVRK